MTALAAFFSHVAPARSCRPLWVAVVLLFCAGHALAAAPVAKLTVVRAVVAGQSVSARLLASDADSDPLTYSIVTPPAVGTLTLDDASTGAFTYSVPYSADPGAARRVTFTFKVNDGTTDSAEQTVYLTVLPRGNRVVAVGQNQYDQLNVTGWRDVVAVSAGGYHTVGLKADGTVVAVGWNNAGQLNVTGWSDVVAVAAGGYHTVGLKADGTVVAVGLTSYDLLNVVGWSDVVAVAAGAVQTVGLKADGTVVAVGNNSAGQLNVTGWRDMVAVSVGDYHTVGLKADGTMVGAGYNDYGQLNVTGWSDVVAVAAGAQHTVGLKADGMVVVVGRNDYGQLNVPGWSVVAVSAGGYHTVGLKADGTVVAVGYNDYGQLNVTGWSDAAAMAAGDYHTVGLMANVTPAASATLYVEPGSPAATGHSFDADGDTLTVTANSDGAYGTVTDNGDGTLTYTPADGFSGTDSFSYAVSDGITSTSVAVTVQVSADWDDDGLPNLWEQAHGLDPIDATGDNGAAGDPDGDGLGNAVEYAAGFDPRNSVPVARLTVVRSVVAGQSVSARLLASDPEGDPFTYSIVTPPVVGTVTLDDAATGTFTYSVPYSADPSAARRVTFTFKVNDGTTDSAEQTVYLTVLPRGNRVVAVGNNGAGQLNVTGWGDVVAVAAGYTHTVGLKADGTVVAAGANIWGETNVSGWSGMVAVAAGVNHTVGLKADGTVVAVGSNHLGQLNVTGWSDVVAVAAGSSHTVGLKADGTVVAVGNNSTGQLDVGGWSDVAAVAAGGLHTVGLKAGGTVVAVGSNLYGQLNVGDWSDVVAVAAGNYHTVGLKAGGTVVGAGSNVYGQLSVGDWSDVVAVSAGEAHTVGLKAEGTVVAVGHNGYGQLNVTGWSDVAVVAAGLAHTVGLKANAAPTASAETLYAEPAVAATTADLVPLASDADGDTLTISAKTDGSHGTVSNNGDGTLTYTPADGFSGADSFTYAVSDGAVSGAPATVTVQVSTDWDGDGLPNVWEQAYGLDPHATIGVNGPEGDPDGDGLNNAAEYAAGTNPVVAETVATPIISLPSGSYEVAAHVSVSTTTGDAVVRYTLDGSDPNAASPTYTDPLSFSAGPVTVKARAFRSGWQDSAVATAGYTFYDGILLKDEGGGLLPDHVQVNSGDSYNISITGGSGHFAASVLGPYGGTTELAFEAGAFTIPAPTRGAFAGDYVVTITDTVTGSTVQATVSVPLAVSADGNLWLVRDTVRRDTEVTVRGASAGATVTLSLDAAAISAGITLMPVNSGHAEELESDGNPAHFILTAPDELAERTSVALSAAVDALEGTGTATVEVPVSRAGQVVGPAGENVSGATVTFMTDAGGSVHAWEDGIGRITATTAVDGRFILLVPPVNTGESHSLQVTAGGYAAATVDAATCTDATPCAVNLVYETTAANPVFTPPAGSYAGSVTVTLESTTVGATLRYTLDGTTPSPTNGTAVASGTAVVIKQSATLKAMAYKEGLNLSDVTSADYGITAARSSGGGGALGLLFLFTLGGLAVNRPSGRRS